MDPFVSLFQSPQKRRADDAARAPRRRQYVKQGHDIEAILCHGQKAIAYVHAQYGKEKAEAILDAMTPQRRPGLGTGSRVINADACPLEAQREPRRTRVDWGFWRRFIEDEMQIRYDQKQRVRFSRALKFVLQKRAEGATSLSALRGERKPKSFRTHGGATNSRKACGLAHALLQYFVDHIQRLQSRSDSHLLMKEARNLRAYLIQEGHPEKDMPKLIGSAGSQWFRRWRLMYGIEMRSSWMKYKVSYKKIMHRVRTYLGNVFRLRRLWELCFGDVPMRWLSIDQKPSWFNNAGLTGTYARRGRHVPTVRENHAKTRERYTILTAVASYPMSDEHPAAPPKCAVLFRAAPDGSVRKKLQASGRLRPWMKVQTQENGSYRSEDVVEALEWMLPAASRPEESIVVVLDWYSGHLTQEVADCVRRKGHVLLFHGGGCTPFTQVNDTHLHALLQRLVTEFENDLALEERERLKLMGSNKMPDLTREDILSLVQMVWSAIKHDDISRKAYLQTGPATPLRGPVKHDEVFKDLRSVLEKIAEGEGRQWDPGFVDMGIRDAAVQFVDEGWAARRWTGWNQEAIDALVEDHTGVAEALEEGQEAFEVEPVDESEGPETDDDEDEDFGGSGLFGPDGGGGRGGSRAAQGGGDAGAGDGDGAGVGGADAASLPGEDQPSQAPPSAAGGDCPPVAAAAVPGPMDVATARRIMYDEAMRRQDDALARRLRKQMLEESRDEKLASSATGLVLRERAEQIRAEDWERRRIQKEKEKEEAKETEERATAKALAQKAAADAKLKALKKARQDRQRLALVKRANIYQTAHQRWLQLEYPVDLAERCVGHRASLRGEQKKQWECDIQNLCDNHIFTRRVTVPFPWDPLKDAAALPEWGYTATYDGGGRQRRRVRCGLPFQDFLNRVCPQERNFGERDAAAALLSVFTKCVPKAKDIFKDTYSIPRLFHACRYVMELSFVFGIVCLGKWVQPALFPCGVYGSWPPELPEDLQAALPAPPAPIEVDSEVESEVD